jgi:hypothetical protein
MHGRSPISELSAHIDKLRAEIAIERSQRELAEQREKALVKRVALLEELMRGLPPEPPIEPPIEGPI